MRTDHDTWDITTSVGSTALFVAAARALEAQKPDPLVVDPYAEVFCRAVGGVWADLLDGAAPEHELKSEFGSHFVDFQAVRTKYFDTYFVKAAAAGVRQVVLLAAGLDSRAYRLDWPADTVVFELDQPQVLDFKRAALAGCRPAAQRREVAVDLRDDWPRALQQHGFDFSAPSAWIVEGLLIYLPATAQVQLFAGIDALSAPGSHAALEESAPMDAAEFAARQDEERAGIMGDRQRPFFQLVYNEQHEPAADWFGARGWRADATPLADYLRAHHRPAPSSTSDAGSMTSTISLISAIKR
jgi:methyltransferase (TIGR00027 family)